MNQADDNTTRFAIVTGGAGGLGREFCLQLARAGWQVAVVDIDRAEAEATLRLVEQAGGTGRVEKCDVTNVEAWHALRDRLQADWPRLDLLVNNAGMYATGRFGQLDLAEADRVIQLNLLSVIYGCDAMIPWLAAAASKESPAHIINIASIFAFYCPPEMAMYNLTKAGVVALSESLHGELFPQGIGVMVVCPGPMPTRLPERALFDNPALQRLTEQIARESTLQPADVATAALRGMQRGQLYVIMGTRERWHWRLKRWLPRIFLDRVARSVRQDLKSLESRVESREPERN